MAKKNNYDKTWIQLLSQWPPDGFHPLVDIQPGYIPGDWKKMQRFDDFTDQQWHKGLPAESVQSEEVSIRTIAMWQGARLTVSDRSKLKAFRDQTEVRVMNVIENCICSIVGRIGCLVQEIPMLFCSADIQSIRIFTGQALSWAGKKKDEETKPEKQVNYVYMATAGPLLTDVRSFTGNPDSVLYRLLTFESVWAVCSKSLFPAIPCSSPVSVRSTWLRSQFKVADKVDFLSEKYYKQNLSAYSAWSFQLHQMQVAQAMSRLHKGSVIVAPGDSIGVCASVWTGTIPVISGDASVSDSHPLVQCETFLQTMHRALFVAETPVLILSYVLGLMSEVERKVVDSWPGPVIMIDSKDVCPYESAVHVGPGVYIRNLEPEFFPVMSVAESLIQHPPQLFSENLVRMDRAWSYEDNPAMQYWKQMHPFKQSQVGVGIPVVNTLAEFCRFRERDQDSDPYLAPIGKIVHDAKPACFHLSTCIRPREVYFISSNHKMVPFLKRFTNWTLHQGRFYFVFVADTHLEWKEMDMGARTYMITVKEDALARQAIKILGTTYPQMWARTVFGLQTFDVSSSLTMLLLYDYVSVLGTNACLSYFPDRESIPPPSETSKKWGGMECQLWKEYQLVSATNVLVSEAYENPMAWRTDKGDHLICPELSHWCSMQCWMEKSENPEQVKWEKKKRGRRYKFGESIGSDQMEELRNSSLLDRQGMKNLERKEFQAAEG